MTVDHILANAAMQFVQRRHRIRYIYRSRGSGKVIVGSNDPKILAVLGIGPLDQLIIIGCV